MIIKLCNTWFYYIYISFIVYVCVVFHMYPINPSRIKWDITKGPLGKLLEVLDTQV